MLIYKLVNPGGSAKDTETTATEATEATAAQTETQAPSAAEKTEASAATVKVPKVTGMSVDDAIIKLNESGLEVKLSPVSDSEKESGKVYSQVPQPGKKVKPGTEVTVYYPAEAQKQDEGEQEQKEEQAQEENKKDNADSNAANSANDTPEEEELNHGNIDSRIAENYSSGKTLYCRAGQFVHLKEDAHRDYTNHLAKIYCGDKVTYLDTVNDFYKVRFDNKEGYVLAEYFSPDPDSPEVGGNGDYIRNSIIFCIASDYMTLWDSPSNSADPITKIKTYEAVYFLEDAGDDFFFVFYNGREGYVRSDEKYWRDFKDPDLCYDQV